MYLYFYTHIFYTLHCVGALSSEQVFVVCAGADAIFRSGDQRTTNRVSSTRVEALLFTYYSLKSDLLYISTVFFGMYSYIIYSPDPIRSQRTSGCFP